jgi:excisionase family DNA binding protein
MPGRKRYMTTSAGWLPKKMKEFFHMGKFLRTVPEAAENVNTVLVVHTLDEAAAILRVRKSWLERQAAARKIPFTMLGGAYRFTNAHLAEIVRMNERIPVAGELRAERTRRMPQVRTQSNEDASVMPLRPRPAGPRRRTA